MIPNFFEPDTSSTATHRITPLNVNNSYLNQNSSKLNNGSFLENRQTPKKQSLNTISIPKLMITETENEQLVSANSTLDNDDTNDIKKICTICNKAFKKPNLLAEFNLDSLEYSPNRKCLNFLENMIFTPKSNSKKPSSVNNTPQSSVKKTLLAKAIKNNANIEKSNVSFDELSIASTCSTKSSYIDESSSLIASPSKPNISSSKMDMTEWDNSYEDDYCEKCRLVKEMESEKQEVSLLIDENEEEMDDEETSKNKKRKVELNSADSEQNLADISNRRSSILSELNGNNPDNAGEKNKKFKNQVTSTPATINHLKLLSNNKFKIDERIPKLNLNNKNLTEGMFFGRGRHHDGSFIRIFFQRKFAKINKENDSGNDLICVWVCRDPYSDKSIIECSMDQSQVKKINY